MVSCLSVVQTPPQCGTLLGMQEIDLDQALQVAQSAADHAKEVREFHARTTPRGSKQREDDIALAQLRIRKAMEPLRSFLGRATYGPSTSTFTQKVERVREASQQLQGQRRRLWKMSTQRQEG